MEIRRAMPEDAALLTEIAFAAKRHWKYSERWIRAWKEVLTMRPESIAREETYLASIEKKVIGFYVLIRKSNRMVLEHLWVAPDAMGQGVGRALFTHAVQRAKALGAEAIEIESDPNAEKFYERMGARRVGENVRDNGGQPRTLPVLLYDCS